MRPKYGNRKTNGYDSRREAKRGADLELQQKAGIISNLQKQVRFELIPKQEGERAVTYVADFTYTEDGEFVVEDVKGFATPEWIIKRKLMLFRHGIRVKIT